MARITTESLRDLRDALDFAEYDRANEEPGAEFAANYNRRELEKLAPDLAADLIDARAAVAEERTRREAAEAEVARLRRELADIDAHNQRASDDYLARFGHDAACGGPEECGCMAVVLLARRGVVGTVAALAWAVGE